MSLAHAFDTLAYAKKLKAAGIDSRAAEAQAEANAEMLGSLLENTLATKQDLNNLETRLEVKLTLRLGAIMVSGIAIITTLFTVMHYMH